MEVVLILLGEGLTQFLGLVLLLIFFKYVKNGITLIFAIDVKSISGFLFLCEIWASYMQRCTCACARKL